MDQNSYGRNHIYQSEAIFSHPFCAQLIHRQENSLFLGTLNNVVHSIGGDFPVEWGLLLNGKDSFPILPEVVRSNSFICGRYYCVELYLSWSFCLFSQRIHQCEQVFNVNLPSCADMRIIHCHFLQTSLLDKDNCLTFGTHDLDSKVSMFHFFSCSLQVITGLIGNLLLWRDHSKCKWLSAHKRLERETSLLIILFHTIIFLRHRYLILSGNLNLPNKFSLHTFIFQFSFTS